MADPPAGTSDGPRIKLGSKGVGAVSWEEGRARGHLYDARPAAAFFFGQSKKQRRGGRASRVPLWAGAPPHHQSRPLTTTE